MLQRIGVGLLVLLAAIPAAAGLTTKSLSDGLTANEIAALLVGPGASISNLKVTGNAAQIGAFTDDGPLGITSGVMLSSGRIADGVGPNKGAGTGIALGGDGQVALDAIVAPYKTFDAAVIEFDVVTESPTFGIKYAFASEEYLEYVGSEFNDIFAFFVNGTNIALAPGTPDPVAVNSINPQHNPNIYRDNSAGGVNLEYDGYTAVLTAVALLEPGQSNHIRIAIADVSDAILDSAIFIAQGGVSGVPIAPYIIPDIDPVALSYATPAVVPLSVYYATESMPQNFSGSGVPDATYSFAPYYRDAVGQLKSTMTVKAGPATPSGTYVAVIRSAAGQSESFATVRVVVDCEPPFILGTAQPQGSVVANGAKAKVSVVPSGSGPFAIQWYRGFPGFTSTPVAGATKADLDTPAITEPSMFWARITNACGSVDSAGAPVTPR